MWSYFDSDLEIDLSGYWASYVKNKRLIMQEFVSGLVPNVNIVHEKQSYSEHVSLETVYQKW